jgi:hypothetical protein
MQTGWIVLLALGIAVAWACWMVARALAAPSEPFGRGGYGKGPESEKQRRYEAKAS